MKRFFLNINCELLLEEKLRHRVLVANPEKLEGISSHMIWLNLINHFWKCEVESWLAEEIVAICNKASENGEKFADLSKVSQAVVIYDGKEPSEAEILKQEKVFLRKFCNLPIFKIMKETTDETILEFDLQNL